MANQTHVERTLAWVVAWQQTLTSPTLTLVGDQLTVPTLVAAMETRGGRLHVALGDEAVNKMSENVAHLQRVLEGGAVVYGVNTGYGGSADVRSDNLKAIQTALIRHLNAGFGPTLDPDIARGVMVVRANSLSLGASGIRPQTVQTLVDLINNDVIPVIPKRGSVSASGDLMPTSYVAAVMMGREDAKVMYMGEKMGAAEALHKAGIEPVTFQAKEALAVVNASSFAATLGSKMVFDANIALLLTELATAMSVESLRGRVETFHPFTHRCMPHWGQMEVASAIGKLLDGSQLARQGLDISHEDKPGFLKQDRYALRSSPQWLGPVVETLAESARRLTTEINSANDNPLIDHENCEIIHGANFQGISIAVAMDQTRQVLQLCGKLLFAQMSEILNVYYSQGLPPNLAGDDISTDFGFKGMDTAMASYMSELDMLTNPVTNHVLSAEMHNQAVNSLALISARRTDEALEILHMMLTNIFCAHAQAIDLRWLQMQTEAELDDLVARYKLHKSLLHPSVWPWYKFAFTPEVTANAFLDQSPQNNINRESFVAECKLQVRQHVDKLNTGGATKEISELLGSGTRRMYLYIREELDIEHYHNTVSPDVALEKIYSAITQRNVKLLMDVFSN